MDSKPLPPQPAGGPKRTSVEEVLRSDKRYLVKEVRVEGEVVWKNPDPSPVPPNTITPETEEWELEEIRDGENVIWRKPNLGQS